MLFEDIGYATFLATLCYPSAHRRLASGHGELQEGSVIIGSPFLKSWVTIYNLKDLTIGLAKSTWRYHAGL